jgi:hypothetical protein
MKIPWELDGNALRIEKNKKNPLHKNPKEKKITLLNAC